MSLSFLMCSERSGSNFITKVLNGHSKICGPSTKHIINPLARNLFRYEPVDKEKNWNILLEDVFRLLNVSFSIWEKVFTLDELRQNVPVGDVRRLILYIYGEEARANGKSHTFVKENQVYEFLPFLLLNFPESKYIYQTRDPRDMALSWKKNLDHPGGIVKAAKQWKQDQQKTLIGFNEQKKINKALYIKYEDLIGNPEFHIARMVEFLGYEFEPSIMEFHKDAITKKNADKQKAWSNLSKGVISDNKDKYLKELKEIEIRIVEKICYFEMIFLGYEPRHSWSELEDITVEEIGGFEREEDATSDFNRSEGVKANMEAKRVFYQKILN